MKNLLDVKKKARMSLNTDQQLFRQHQFKNSPTQTYVKSIPPSQETIQNHHNNTQNFDQFPIQQLLKTFNILSKDGNRIIASDLNAFLQQQNQQMYMGLEMILLLDKDRKGYVTKQQFLDFFQKKNQENQIQMPQQLIRDREWVRVIQENQSLLSNFSNFQYCEYAAKKLIPKK